VWEVIDNSITIITMAPTTEIPLVFKRRWDLWFDAGMDGISYSDRI